MNVDKVLKQFDEFEQNNCCYLWGAQGEHVLETTIDTIKAMENSPTNARRVLSHIGDLIEKGKDLTRALFFDCSGMILYVLNREHLYIGDATANTLYECGTPINPVNARKGDLVFTGTRDRKDHVGIVGKGGDVYECKGRDYGVVKSHVSRWNFAARYTWFEDMKLTRKLKVSKQSQTGNDVSDVQRALNSHGFPCKVTGTYTTNTKDAVTKFQKAAGLSVMTYGVVAKKTAEALGFTWAKK